MPSDSMEQTPGAAPHVMKAAPPGRPGAAPVPTKAPPQPPPSGGATASSRAQSQPSSSDADLRKARVHDLEQEVAEVQQRLDCACQALTEAQVTEANAKLDLEAAEAAVGAYRASRGSPDTSRQDDTEYKPSEPSQPGWDFKTQFKNAVNASEVVQTMPSSSSAGPDIGPVATTMFHQDDTEQRIDLNMPLPPDWRSNPPPQFKLEKWILLRWNHLTREGWSAIEDNLKGTCEHFMGEEGPQPAAHDLLRYYIIELPDWIITAANEYVASRVDHRAFQEIIHFDPVVIWNKFVETMYAPDGNNKEYMLMGCRLEIWQSPRRLLSLFVGTEMSRERARLLFLEVDRLNEALAYDSCK